MGVEQAVIYPSRSFTFTQPNPMTPEEIGREIVRLMNRGPGILQPSRVSQKDGTAFTGVPFGFELQEPRGRWSSASLRMEKRLHELCDWMKSLL